MKTVSLFPQLVDTWLDPSGNRFFLTDRGGWGLGFELTPLELELQYTHHLQSAFQKLTLYLRKLNPGIRMRFVSQRRKKDEIGPHVRQRAIHDLTFFDTRLFLFFEKEERFSNLFLREMKGFFKATPAHVISKSEAQEMVEQLDLGMFEGLGFAPAPISEQDLKSFFPHPSFEESIEKSAIDYRGELKGVIRLWKLGATQIPADYLTLLRSSRFLDSDLVVTIRRVSKEMSQLKLQLQKKRNESGLSLSSAEKVAEAEKSYSDAIHRGETQCEMEWNLILSRQNEEKLRADCLEMVSTLNSLGEVMWEKEGVPISFESTLPGSPIHVGFYAKDHQVPFLLPIFMVGSSQRQFPSPAQHALPVHRRDQSLFYFDLYDSKHVNRNTLILGPSGLGKSGFVNHLIYSLSQNENYHVTLMEVGSSFRRLFSLLGGQYYDLEVGSPSGINPFQLVKGRNWGIQDEEKRKEVKILTEYVSSLLLENDERKLTKEMKSDVGVCVSQYLESGQDALSLDGFIEFSGSKLPRAKILSRWGKKGVYGSFFLPKTIEGNPRFRGFNYKSIGDASDPDLAQGGVATLLANFELEILNKKPGHRPILVVDECKFFFSQSYSAFSYLVTDVRKLGGTVILMSQYYSDFQIPGVDGHAVDTIFENCFIHILFDKAGNDEDFLRRHHFKPLGKGGEEDLEKVGNLYSEPGVVSECVLSRQGMGSQVLSIQQTPEEFIRTSTDAAVTEEIDRLISEIPGLSYAGAIQALGLKRKQNIRSKEGGL